MQFYRNMGEENIITAPPEESKDGVETLTEEVADIILNDDNNNDKDKAQNEVGGGEEEEKKCPHLHQANPKSFKNKIFLDAKCGVI